MSSTGSCNSGDWLSFSIKLFFHPQKLEQHYSVLPNLYHKKNQIQKKYLKVLFRIQLFYSKQRHIFLCYLENNLKTKAIKNIDTWESPYVVWKPLCSNWRSSSISWSLAMEESLLFITKFTASWSSISSRSSGVFEVLWGRMYSTVI